MHVPDTGMAPQLWLIFNFKIFWGFWNTLKNIKNSLINEHYKACVSHSQASHTHDAIAEAAQLMKEAVDDIMVTLNEAASEVGMVGGMVDSIADAMAKVSVAVHGGAHKMFDICGD